MGAGFDSAQTGDRYDGNKADAVASDPFQEYRLAENKTNSNKPAEKSADSSADKPADAPATTGDAKDSWTIVLDLRMSFSEKLEQERPDHFINGNLKRLEELAKQTEGTDVTFVVQAQHRPDDPAVTPTGEPNASNEIVDRYIIKDGKITPIGSSYSQGMKDDLKSVLQLATEVAPSEHIGLIEYAHGDGANGMAVQNNFRGDTMSLDDLNSAIEEGLEGSSHEKLDVLAFDACSMGSSAVLDKLQGAADHVVASEEYVVESNGNYDMLNVSAVLENVLKNPEMTPVALAQQFVTEAKEGSNGTPIVDPENANIPLSGTPTLANFDMSEYADFEKALDSFGDTLDQAMKNDQTEAAIKKIVEFTDFALCDQNDRERDLLSFVNLVEQAIANRELEDPTGQISQAAEQLEKEFLELRKDYYGDANTYDQMGGLSVEFPTFDPLPHGKDYFASAWANYNT